ncbi:MAG: chlorophyll a/b-binding protein [Nodosilinea sp.]
MAIPPAVPDSQEWGFTPAAEILNGRLAMLGFAFAVIIEVLSGQGVLHFLNLV